MDKKLTFGQRVKEAFRKFLVALKRKPNIIPLVVFVAAFLFYSLNLANISDTTAKIQGAGMGLVGFITMLFSMLSMVCYMNAFPHRKPVVWPMLILHIVMDGILIFCDFYYRDRIIAALTRAESPIEITPATAYIAKAYNMLNTHMIILVVGIVLLALLPLYSKLIRSIKTSIEVEGSGNLGEIDISAE